MSYMFTECPLGICEHTEVTYWGWHLLMSVLTDRLRLTPVSCWRWPHMLSQMTSVFPSFIRSRRDAHQSLMAAVHCATIDLMYFSDWTVACHWPRWFKCSTSNAIRSTSVTLWSTTRVCFRPTAVIAVRVWTVWHCVRVRFTSHAYADDTQLYISVPAASCLEAIERFAGCLERVRDWMASNRLKLNEDKMQIIWLGTRHQLNKTLLALA